MGLFMARKLVLVLVVTACVFSGTADAWGWSWSSGSTTTFKRNNQTAPILPRNIEVNVWNNEFYYKEWVSKHAPFYIDDVLVFKYNNNQTHHYKNDVYLLPDVSSYKSCDVRRGKKLEGRRRFWSSSLEGFKLVLRKTQPYYFASGYSLDCYYNMKFSLAPIPRSCQTLNDFACCFCFP